MCVFLLHVISLPLSPCSFFRSLGFAGTASEAVHYALHYLAPLLTSNLASSRQNGRISCDQEVCPRLQLPDVFQLLHHANQVTPMLVLEAVVGERGVVMRGCGRLSLPQQHVVFIVLLGRS